MITAVCWKWKAAGGPDFGPEYVNALRAGLARHLHLAHELVCVTDDPVGIDPRVRIIGLPPRYQDTPRCRKRMRIFDRAFAESIGSRLLCLDLDVVIVDDLTPIVNRPEPLVCWRVRHANVFSGSFFLMDAGVLHGLWTRFDAAPIVFPRKVQSQGVPSDQAMLNYYLTHVEPQPVATWTEADGFVTYFGDGYEHLEHLGVGPRRQTLPAHARIVVLGSADKAVMDEGRFEWIRTHWSTLRDEVAA